MGNKFFFIFCKALNFLLFTFWKLRTTVEVFLELTTNSKLLLSVSSLANPALIPRKWKVRTAKKLPSVVTNVTVLGSPKIEIERKPQKDFPDKFYPAYEAAQRKGRNWRGPALLSCFYKLGTERACGKRRAFWKWRLPSPLRSLVTAFAPALRGQMAGRSLSPPQDGLIVVKPW